jgi:RNA polymerase sigma-70 factor (ECF subfamily)
MTKPTRGERFQAMYVAHYAAILGYCIRRIGHDDAHDAASEVFTVAWRRIDDMPADERALPWLFGVAARTLSNRYRSRRRRARLAERVRGLGTTHAPSPEVQVVRRQEDQVLMAALHRLRPNDREVLLLSAWEGLPASQIALRYGISAKAAEKRLTRAKQRLASQLERTQIPATVATPQIMQEGGSQ